MLIKLAMTALEAFLMIAITSLLFAFCRADDKSKKEKTLRRVL